MIKLSKRLVALFDMIEDSEVVADIGCDHALLSIALIQQKKCKKVYACDVNEGPLQRAKEAIISAHLEDYITPILSNGLKEVHDDTDTVVIAGMGWETIVSILMNDIHKVKSMKSIILQSNTHVDDLRRWISNNGFKIDKECIVKDNHYYQILKIHYETEILNEDQILFGKCMKRDELFKEYWNDILLKKQRIIQQIPKNSKIYLETKMFIEKIENKLLNL